MLRIGVESESLHLWFQNGRMDIFEFVEKAHELGFEGVEDKCCSRLWIGPGLGDFRKQ